MKILEWLKGKKSYLVGLGVIVYGVYQHYFGTHLSWPETMDYIFGGSGFMTFRAALAKETVKKGDK